MPKHTLYFGIVGKGIREIRCIGEIGFIVPKN